MDALGVDVQVVSPTDCFYQYHRDPATTARIAAECNDEVAEMVRAHPARFMGLGTLPMQDVDRTLAEMRRGIEELGLVGFMIDDHVNGLTYDHEVFDASGRRPRSSGPSSSSTRDGRRSSPTGPRSTSCPTRSATWSIGR